MDATEWVLMLILGGILGMIGQGIRVVAGLKKIHDQALAQGKDFNALFQGSSLGLSLLIGFIAGALAIIAVVDHPPTANPSKQLIISIIGAGYAGTDFIEGFIKKNMAGSKTEK